MRNLKFKTRLLAGVCGPVMVLAAYEAARRAAAEALKAKADRLRNLLEGRGVETSGQDV